MKEIPAAGEADSAARTVERFDTKESAAKYASSLVGTRTHERESHCVRAGLAGVPKGAHVLDLPCGTGRFEPLLAEMGFRVTGADSSPHMIEQARAHVDSAGLSPDTVDLRVANALDTDFDDDTFDAVLCNRLVHHLFESDTRRKLFRELRRISQGTVLVSFFCTRSIDSVHFSMRNRLRGIRPDDRVPISTRQLREDVEAAGLEVQSFLPTRSVISRQWYAVLRERSE